MSHGFDAFFTTAAALIDDLSADSPRVYRRAGLAASRDLSRLSAYRMRPMRLRRVDEIQVVPGWEMFARRLLDTEQVELFLSGSSARLLSREVATSMRGRAMEALVHPFSFREFLRHSSREPEQPPDRLPKAARSSLEKHLRSYLAQGGFPEALGAAARDQFALLRAAASIRHCSAM